MKLTLFRAAAVVDFRRLRRYLSWTNREGTTKGDREEVISSIQEAPSVKEQLRRLYKMVHPDLFHKHPEAKATNETSFQLLQEYLNDSFGIDKRSNTSMYSLSFYIRPDGEDMRRINVSLPPPSRHGSWGKRGQVHFSSGTLKGLAVLFEQCGLGSHLRELERNEKLDWNSMRIEDFLPLAVERLRKNENSTKTAQYREAVMRTALQLGKNLRVAYSESVASRPSGERLQLLENLASALDSLPHLQLDGLTVKMGNLSGVDKHGVIRLDVQGCKDSFVDVLQQIDVDTARAYHSVSTERLRIEKLVAKNLGIASIFADPGLRTDQSYQSFLEKLGEFSHRNGSIVDPDLSMVSMKVQAPPQICTDGQACWLDRTAGHVGVSVVADPESVYMGLTKHGVMAQRVQERILAEKQHLLELKKLVRLRLGLRYLEQDNDISLEQFRNCCSRLLRGSKVFRLLTEGSSVKIADRNDVCEDGKFIILKWDCKM